MFSKFAGIALALSLSLVATAGQATTFNYVLDDHPFGGLTNAGSGGSSNYKYGLRLDNAIRDDGMMTNDGRKVFSFGLGSGAFLTYNDDTGTARIFGDMVLNDSMGNPIGPDSVFQVDYQMTGLTNLAGTPGFFSDGTGAGSGTISNGSVTYLLGAKADGGLFFEFDDDGYRIPGNNTAIVGRGWVDPKNGLGGANDFLFTAISAPPGVIPLPAAGWMLIAGVAGLGYVGRRKRKNS